MSHSKLFRDSIRAQLVNEEETIDWALSSESAVEELEHIDTMFHTYRTAMEGLSDLDAQVEAGSISLESAHDQLTALTGVEMVGNESFGDRIRSVIAAIMRAFDRFLEFVRSVFEAIFNDVNQVRAFLNDTRLRLSSRRGSFPGTPQIPLGRQAPFLSTDRMVPRSVRHITNGLNELRMQMSLVRSHYAEVVASIGQNTPALLQRIDLNASADSDSNVRLIAELNREFSRLQIEQVASKITQVSPMVDARFPAGATFVGSPLIGMRSLVFIYGDKLKPEDSASTDPVRKSYAIQSSRIVFTRGNPNRKITATDATVEAMPYAAIIDFLNVVETLVVEVARAYQTPLRKNLRLTSKEIQRALNRLETVQGGNTHQLFPFINFCKTYIDWAKSPYMQMLSMALVTSREAILFARKHVRNL